MRTVAGAIIILSSCVLSLSHDDRAAIALGAVGLVLLVIGLVTEGPRRNP